MPEQTTPSEIVFTREDIEGTVSGRFDRIASLYADKEALVGPEGRLTYRELQTSVDRLAATIQHHTPQGEGCVAFLLGQSTHMVVAALAILKAGKVQLALHPRLPDEALKAILEDAGPQLLVTKEDWVARARSVGQESCTVIHLDEKEASLTPARTDVSASSPCTILYTSGTTQKPKGVVKSHRAILHRVWLAQEHDRVAPGDRASLLTHAGFASAEADIFATLLLGACVCVDDPTELGFKGIRQWLDRERITLFHPPVILFRQFLRSLDSAVRFEHVRLVALAGEAVLREDLLAWKRHFSDTCEMRHRFSTTETAMLAVAHFREVPEEIHCGHPIEDKELTLYSDGQPVPIGEVGELVVRSRYLADGYWRRPQETRAAFSHCSQSPGWRVYRTGDLGRFHQQGHFEFLGRRDDQIKVRGYRLSTREVESALLNLPEVKEAAVLVERSGTGAEMTAWVGLSHLKSPEEIRAHLSQRLPEWKIPSRIFVADELPKTLTHKIDKPALRNDLKHNGPKTRPDLEDTLLSLWTGLGRPPVQSQDDLLSRGADSITVVLFLHELEKSLGVELLPREFFELRTLARLAELIRERMGLEASKSIEPKKAPERTTNENVSDGFLSLLVSLGVEYLFLNPGTDSAPLLESLVKFSELGRQSPKLVLCLHEAVAMSCAHGYFMVSGRPQMVFVHVGLGTQNIGGQLHNAHRGEAGVVLVAGRSPFTTQGGLASRDRYAHWIQEELDQSGSVSGCVKWHYQLPCSENLVQALERAFHLAEQAPAGPVYLTVPREVMMAPLAEEPSRSRPTRRSRKSADRSNLARAVQMILDCQNPILLASRSGADPESVAALVNFCELAAIPVVETRHRMNFPHSHPLHLGFSANAFLPQADLVIMLDHHVPWIPNQWKPEAHCKIIQIDCDTQKSSIPIWGFPVDLSLESEAVEALTQLSEGLTRCLDQSGRRKVEERRQAVQSRHQELRARWKEDAISSSNDRPVSARWFFHRLNSFLDEQALVVCDAATNNPAAWKYLTLDRPGSFFQSLGSCLGWGLGAAIGAGLAAPERQIVAILGDGSWMFANPLAAYETAREQGVTFLTVVLNNTQYAAIVEAVCSVAPGGYARDSGNYPGCSLPSPGYYARIGQAAGLWTRCVLEPGEVNGVLREAFEVLNQGRSALVEVHVSANHGRS